MRKEGERPPRRPVLVREDYYQAMFEGHFKLVADRVEGRYSLFDLSNDYSETKNLFMTEGFEDVSRRMYTLFQSSPISPRFRDDGHRGK